MSDHTKLRRRLDAMTSARDFWKDAYQQRGDLLRTLDRQRTEAWAEQIALAARLDRLEDAARTVIDSHLVGDLCYSSATIRERVAALRSILDEV